MRLVRFELSDGRTSWGQLSADGGAVREPGGELASSSLVDVLDRPPPELAAALNARDAVEHPRQGVRLLAPVDRPSKVIGVGRNYRDHVAETGSAEPAFPMLFGVLPSAITGPTDDIELPALSNEVDWEGELGIVIGRRAKGVQRRAVAEFVAGYIVINDISARDLQRQDGQWTRAKSFDTFKPTGPCMTTVDELGLGRSLPISVTVNGEEKQHSTTDDMIFPVDVLVEYVSAFCTLFPGDIIATGTPGGVGAGRTPPTFLKPDDVVETEIEGIGQLVNRTIIAPRSELAGV